MDGEVALSEVEPEVVALGIITESLAGEESNEGRLLTFSWRNHYGWRGCIIRSRT